MFRHPELDARLVVHGDDLWLLADGKAVGSLMPRLHATYDLKVYLLQALRRHVVAHPRVSLVSHIDDFGQDSSDWSVHVLVETIVRSAVALAAAFDELQLPLADKKLVCLSSSKEVLQLLVQRLGRLAGAAVQVARVVVDVVRRALVRVQSVASLR